MRFRTARGLVDQAGGEPILRLVEIRSAKWRAGATGAALGLNAGSDGFSALVGAGLPSPEPLFKSLTMALENVISEIAG